jgi:diguanylate cyclase (GGDEF)-like protein
MKFKNQLFFTLSLVCILFVLAAFITYNVLSINTHNITQLLLWYYFVTISIIAALLAAISFISFKYILIFPDKNNLHTITYIRSAKLSDDNIKIERRNYSSQPIPGVKTIPPDKAANVKIEHYDTLTSLPNRVFFNEVLSKALLQAKRHNKYLAILFIDFDHFKAVNKHYSEHYGDFVLKEMAQRFMDNLRAGDIIARLGGDEFIVLLNDIEDPRHAGIVADKLLQACQQSINLQGQTITLKASIGVSIYPNDGESLEDLQKNADIALYKAKRSGGSAYQYYRTEMDIAVHEHIRFENALQQALQKKQFILFFQPQLNLESGNIEIVEALIRWDHPTLGLLNPERFIPLAEESGLILPIGEWAIREACRITKSWHNAGFDPITVAVNISPKQFREPNLENIIANCLTEFDLAPQFLEVEVTETAVMDNVDIAIDKMKKIHEMGVKVAIDDFGTGYTSINYLRKFPVSVLKIDQTFIKGIPKNQNDVAITSAVISLGHNLGLDVVAEGVESLQQIQYLAENNCDLIQGYFISRPLPASKIILQFNKSVTLDTLIHEDK